MIGNSELNSESKKVMARYRAKKSYLIRKKNLSAEEAEKLAKPILQELQNNADQRRLRLVSSYEPSKKEITEEIERQKFLGIFTEAPTLRAEWSTEYPKTVEKRLSSKKFLQIVIYSAIVVAATAVLVNSSLTVFGTDWQGWTKAILLEAGIIALVAVIGESLFQKVILKTTMAFFVFLSFAVLHTGVETDRHSNLLATTTNSTAISSLKQERNRYLANHDSLPESHVTKRNEIMGRVSQLNEKIVNQTTNLTASPASTVINLSNTEMMIRAALLLLNIIFGHRLFKLLSTLKWQQIKYS